MEIKSKSLQEIKKIKSIIKIIITLLEDNINTINDGKVELDENQKDLLNFLIGNKNNVVSIIAKLSDLIIKLDEVSNDDGEQQNCNIAELKEIDFTLLKKFLTNIKNGKK